MNRWYSNYEDLKDTLFAFAVGLKFTDNIRAKWVENQPLIWDLYVMTKHNYPFVYCSLNTSTACLSVKSTYFNKGWDTFISSLDDLTLALMGERQNIIRRANPIL